jgi:hypothetical protein
MWKMRVARISLLVLLGFVAFSSAQEVAEDTATTTSSSTTTAEQSEELDLDALLQEELKADAPKTDNLDDSETVEQSSEKEEEVPLQTAGEGSTATTTTTDATETTAEEAETTEEEASAKKEVGHEEEKVETKATPMQSGPFIDLLGEQLYKLDMLDETHAQLRPLYTNEALKGKKVVGLYFSADWVSSGSTRGRRASIAKS